MSHDRSPSPSDASAADASAVDASATDASTSAASPHSLPKPLSIAERRRLQAHWEQAWNALRSPNSDRKRIHHLIRECVIRDPASPVYVDVLLANCALAPGAADSASPVARRAAHHNKNANWFRRWQARARIAAAVERQDWPAVLRDGPDALFANPTHLATLLALADACTQFGYRDAAWKYLEAALRSTPDDPAVQRRTARALARRGQFDDAAAQWRRLHEQLPTDDESRRWLERLSPVSSTAAPQPTIDLADAAELRFDELLSAGHFAAARQLLVESRQHGGQSLAWNDRAEDLTIAEHWQQVAVARRIATAEPQGDWGELIGELARTALRVEVELLANRLQRRPGDATLRFRLAMALKRQGNWSEAIRQLEGAAGPDGDAAEAKLEQGECWQRLRQFARAAECYRSALASVGENNSLRERIQRRLAPLQPAGVHHRGTENTERTTED